MKKIRALGKIQRGYQVKTKTDINREGYCVCCPKCGKVLSRSLSMDSVIVCGRCGFKSHANVKRGTVFITDARYAADENYISRITGEEQAQEEKLTEN